MTVLFDLYSGSYLDTYGTPEPLPPANGAPFMPDSLILDGSIELLGGGAVSALPQCPGAVFRLGNGFDLGMPQPEQALVAKYLLDGERPFGRRTANRTFVIPVTIIAPDRDTLAAARETLFTIVDQDTWNLTWTRQSSPGVSGPTLVFDCFRAQPSTTDYDQHAEKDLRSLVTLTFPGLPFGRADAPLQLQFTSPATGSTAPPAPVTVDAYTAVGSTTQASWWFSSSLMPAGGSIHSAHWDWSKTNNDSPAWYTDTNPAVNITGLTKLTFWFGLGTNNYKTWNKGNVAFALSLSDGSGHTISFGGQQYCHASNSPNSPTWQLVSFSIPQAGTFDFTNVTGYSVKAWRKVKNDGSLYMDADVYLNALTAYAPTAGTPASVRGGIYTLLGIQGSARSPLSLLLQQPPIGTLIQTTYSTPGPVTVLPGAGVSYMAFDKTAGGGKGGKRTSSGQAGGAGGGEQVQEVRAVTPGVGIPCYVGAGGHAATAGGWIQRVAVGKLTSATATTWQGNCTVTTSAGNTLLIGIAFGTTGGTVTAVADTKGNTWVQDKQANLSGRCMEVWRAAGAAQMTPTDTFTVTISAGQANGGLFLVGEFPPLSAPDASGQAGGSSSVTTQAPNMTATASDGVAVAFGCNMHSSDSVSVASPFTKDGSYQTASTGSAGCSMIGAYDNSPAAGSLTATFTMASSASGIAFILGYPVNAAGSQTNGSDTWTGADDATAAHGGHGVADNATGGGTGGTGAAIPQLMSGDISTFEGGISTWLGSSNSSVAQSAAQAHGGSKSLAVTSTASGNMTAASCLLASILTGAGFTQLVPGASVISASGWVKAATAARTVQLQIEQVDATGATLGNTNGPSATDSTSAWTQYTVQAAAAANAAGWRVKANVLSTGAGGETHYLDDVLCQAGAVFQGGNGAASGTTGGGGGSSGGTAAAGNNAAGQTGGAAPAGGAAGGNGGAAGTNPGAAGSAPGGGGGGASSTGAATNGGNAGDGQLVVSYIQQLAGFKTSLVHLPGPDAPAAFSPLVVVGGGADIPDGTTEYPVPAVLGGQNARFNGTYSIILTAFSWHSPASARLLTVTVKQYEYAGGPSVSVAASRTVTPNTDVANGIVVIDNVTLPISDIPADNSSSLFTVTVTSGDTADLFLDVLFIDTEGQFAMVNIPSGSGYTSFWLDEPDPTQDLGLALGSTYDRSQAVSITGLGTVAVPSFIASGGPLTVDPGLNQLLVYAIEGQPSLTAWYFPRFWVDRTLGSTVT
jgi:hypothetical protein